MHFQCQSHLLIALLTAKEMRLTLDKLFDRFGIPNVAEACIFYVSFLSKLRTWESKFPHRFKCFRKWKLNKNKTWVKTRQLFNSVHQRTSPRHKMDDLDDRFDRLDAEEREERWEEDEAPLNLREPRLVWDRHNPVIEFDDKEFRVNFRVCKENFLKIVDLIRDDLIRPNQRGRPITVLMQVALTLAFFACGSFQRIAGYQVGVKKSCACVTIKRVTVALNAISHLLIALPTTEEMRKTSDKLFDRFGIRNVVLGVDGTHIRLERKPLMSEMQAGCHPQDFWSRKQGRN
jgi:hypothetical protein